MPGIYHQWAVIGARGDERLVLDTAPTRAEAEALRHRYAACLEGYDGIVVEGFPVPEYRERQTARRAGKRQPRLPRGQARKGS